MFPANGTVREKIENEVIIKCHVISYPKPKITWQRTDAQTLTVSDMEQDGRIVIDTKSYPEFHSSSNSSQWQIITIESSLIFKSLMRTDNGSYTCKAQSIDMKPLSTHFTVVALEVPEVHIEKLEIENKSTAVVSFVVDFDGNSEITQNYLEIMNYTNSNLQWTGIPNFVVQSNQNNSSFVVENLIPGASYGFRFSSKNEVGQSEWSYMNISIPPDVPSPIANVHLLSKTNETLLFGWRRPIHDNGGSIVLYQMTLRDSMKNLVSNQTLDITVNGVVQVRNSYMYMFPNLKPGSQYNFQVRACSNIGCSEWSNVLDAVTSDGYSDPPLAISLQCTFDFHSMTNNATLSWSAPTNPRGSILGYNISLEGYANYKNANNRIVLDQFRMNHQLDPVLQYRMILKPNSNYSVRLCAINKAGCGQNSHITSASMCKTAPVPPQEFPSLKFERLSPLNAFNNKNGASNDLSPLSFSHQLKLFVPRLSERNGAIQCYRVIVVRLPDLSVDNNITDKSDMLDKYLNTSPKSIKITSYKLVNQQNSRLIEPEGYVAKEFTSENFNSDIIIGNGITTRCFEDNVALDVKTNGRLSSPFDENRFPRRINYEYPNNQESYNQTIFREGYKEVEDGELLSNTYYSALLEITVVSWNNTILYERSPFVEPISTGPLNIIVPEQDSLSFSDTINGILLGTICALVLVLLLLFSVLCFLKRKAHETSITLEDERIGLTSILTQSNGSKRKSSIFQHINLNSNSAIKKWTSKPIPLSNIVATFQERHANSDLLFQIGLFYKKNDYKHLII